MDITIRDIIPRMILDSRGDPTVEVEMVLSDDSRHFASVPSGASTGKYEAVELRDEDRPDFYGGKGVLKALVNIDTLITPYLIGIDPSDQSLVDEKVARVDLTENFAKVGANASLAVSIAALKAGAYVQKRPLYSHIMNLLKTEYNVTFASNLAFPIPTFNIMNGGKHADDNIAIQEFMVIPVGIADIRDRIRAGSEIFHALKTILKSQNIDTDVGNEGGFAPILDSDPQALDFIVKAIKKAGYDPKTQVQIGLDVAVSQFYDEERALYSVPHQEVNGRVQQIDGSSRDLIQYYVGLMGKYPIYSIEDGLHEDDWGGFATLKPIMEVQKKLCVGDDLTVTNPKRIQEAIQKSAINAVIIKPNQIGSVSLTFEAIKLCKENDIKIIVSHRSGETADTFISHLAVGAQADFLKAGATHRSERTEKYNELLRMITPQMAKTEVKNMLKKIIPSVESKK